MPTHHLDLATTAGSNGSASVTFICSCGRKSRARSWELAFADYRTHRDETDAAEAERVKLDTGKRVIVADESHPHFDRIGTITVLGDTTAWVDFDGEELMIFRSKLEVTT